MALKDSSEPFKPHFVVGAPSSSRLIGDYEKALAILQLGPGQPEVIEETDIPLLVDRIEGEIKAHDGRQ